MLICALPLWCANDDADIRNLLTQQTAAWNRGDIEGFMRTYEASDQTTYAGSGGITKGHSKVLERYQKKYSTRQAMGQLRFSDLSVRFIGPAHAIVTGQFHLQRETSAGGPASGWFTLVLSKNAAGWKIIHDHTS
ncbi:MAG: nuclear transport factor 2 family protein [Candidatus Solibacter usitatus]|nr:nuclear transport factor 2 family protein [Candidatus Solibacter usitatus]